METQVFRLNRTLAIGWLLACAGAACAAIVDLPTTTLYVGRHFEVRDHDARVN